MDLPGVQIMLGSKLSEAELNLIKYSRQREFQEEIEQAELDQMMSSHIFIFRDQDAVIMSHGELIEISPVKLGDETFSILGISGIIAEEKGKGYGRMIMEAMKQYLLFHKKTGVGFCIAKNKGFYEKCGYITDGEAIKKLVYPDGAKKIANIGNDYVFYVEGEDQLFQKAVKSRSEIILPRVPNW